MQDELQRRKTQHLDLALRDEVEPEETDPLFHRVRLVHRALPELRLSDVDLSIELSGGRLRAPVMIVGMTGGTDRAGQVNRDLARVAEEEGVAFPKFREATTDDEREKLGTVVQGLKKIVPTHPHPMAPDHPPFNALLAPGAALVDRVRDLLTGRGTA